MSKILHKIKIPELQKSIIILVENELQSAGEAIPNELKFGIKLNSPFIKELVNPLICELKTLPNES